MDEVPPLEVVDVGEVFGRADVGSLSGLGVLAIGQRRSSDSLKWRAGVALSATPAGFFGVGGWGVPPLLERALSLVGVGSAAH